MAINRVCRGISLAAFDGDGMASSWVDKIQINRIQSAAVEFAS
jgi:hypothetical protein